MLQLDDLYLAGRLGPLTLSLPSPAPVALIGPNGSGKSTLLTLLAGLQRPDRGAVHLKGRDLATLDGITLAQWRALLAQRPAACFGMPVFELLTLGLSASSVARGAERLIAELELAPLLAREVSCLSGGELQRVQIARTLLQIWPDGQQKLLLLDEPLAGLDLHHQQALLTLLRELAGQGILVIASIHDLNMALHWGEQLICLAQGQCAYQGGPADLTPDLLERVFKIKTGRVEAAGRQWLLPLA